MKSWGVIIGARRGGARSREELAAHHFQLLWLNRHALPPSLRAIYSSLERLYRSQLVAVLVLAEVLTWL